ACPTCLPFFVPAEDGIRAFHVTGVQTCALPIFERQRSLVREGIGFGLLHHDVERGGAHPSLHRGGGRAGSGERGGEQDQTAEDRSEERRVGTEWSGRGAAAGQDATAAVVRTGAD